MVLSSYYSFAPPIAGSSTDCLLKAIVWLKDQRQAEEFDRIDRGYFSSPRRR
jgi:hypothetical protein